MTFVMSPLIITSALCGLAALLIPPIVRLMRPKGR
jgi:hypothetical protein